MLEPTSIDELKAAVLSAPQILAVGAGTKMALRQAGSDVSLISLKKLAGLVEYEPSEYTFTALAGTKLADIATALSAHGQYLPFDPVFAGGGSTLGGCVAGNGAGPGRLRYGGVRDFCIGVRWVNGAGHLIHGGGKVVKNAAGFDFPKLMIGSAGRLGALAEFSFKVFPAPQATLTIEVCGDNLGHIVEKMQFAARQNWEVEALEIVPPNFLYLRIIGHAAALQERADKIMQSLACSCRVVGTNEAASLWRSAVEFSWAPAQSALVRVTMTSSTIPALDAALGDVPRQFSMAGNIAWIAWPGSLDPLHTLLVRLQLSAVVWRGGDGRSRLGHWPSLPLERMVKRALDPTNRFPDFPVP